MQYFVVILVSSSPTANAPNYVSQLNSSRTAPVALIAALITVPSKPSVVAFALMVRHTHAVAARFLACQTLLIHNFTVIASQPFWATAFIVANTFTSIRARNDASCCNREAKIHLI